METHRYSVVKAAIVRALQDGKVQHETRGGQPDENNYLQVGSVEPSFVLRAIRACPASRTSRAEHHQRPGVNVWVVRPVIEGTTWYIKFYFDEESEAWFISVHPARPDEGRPTTRRRT